VPAAARERPRSIVVCDLQLPRDDLEGGSTRMRGIVRALLADDWDVVFAALDGDETSPVADELSAEGCRVVAGLGGIVAALPRPPEAILLSRPETFGAFALHLKGTWPQSALIYDTVDLHADRVRAHHARRGIEADGFADVVASFEQAAFTASDLVLAVSEDEAGIVRERAPGCEAALVPVLYRVTDHPAPRSARHGMAFIGGYRHVPNVDAALRLGTQVFTRVRAANADETLTIAGAFPPHDVVALAQQPGIGVCGWVDDIDAFHGTHVALVAPIDWGAGINSKIVAALAAGLPVVTTPFGATGLGAVAGEHLLVGETDAELAELYLRVATDQGLWQRLADAGQALVRERFEPAVAVAPLLQWLEQQRGSEPHTDASASTIVRA
jgi:glycosyltransferase involved in cell wall biosynthesis